MPGLQAWWAYPVMDTNPIPASGDEPLGPPGSALTLPASARGRFDPFQDERRRRIRLIAAACLGVAIFLVDTLTPADIEFAGLYVIVLILAGRGIEGRRIWIWTAACLLGSMTSFVLLVDPITDSPAVVRLAIAVVAILCTAVLIAQQSTAATIMRRQSRALDVAGTAILLRSRSGEILLWNRAAEELYGWTRDEAVGRNADSLLASLLPEALDAIHAQLETRGLWEGEIQHRHRNGHGVTVLSRWTLQSDEGGRAPMIVETDVDAHIQRAAELLRLSELRYRTIFDSLAVAVLEHDFRAATVAFDMLRAQGVPDIRAYLAENPAFVRDLQKAVRITGANDTALRMLDTSFQGGAVRNARRHPARYGRVLRVNAWQAIAEGAAKLPDRDQGARADRRTRARDPHAELPAGWPAGSGHGLLRRHSRSHPDAGHDRSHPRGPGTCVARRQPGRNLRIDRT